LGVQQLCFFILLIRGSIDEIQNLKAMNERRIISLLVLMFIAISVNAQEKNNLEAITNHGRFYYQIDNSGDMDVSSQLQKTLDEIAKLEDVSATLIFSPGIYFLDAPVEVNIMSVKLVGHGHGGIDIHGANLASGTIFRFGKNSGPNCITFNYAGRSKAFPSGETPWHNKNLKVEIENITFVGYNNTGVNTADGYSRFRGDEPNFRGLSWYPAEGRYQNVEREGQRAIYLPKAPLGQGHSKCELLRVNGCYFTDLYVGIDIANCDVSYINNNWFGQLTYGIRLHGDGQGMMINNNLFADLETALKLGDPNFSTFSHNTFAYVSKCFEIREINNSIISGNALLNWEKSTGAAAFGAFIYVQKSMNLNVIGNSVGHALDSRKKTITIDPEPNGQSFIQFDNSNQLNFSNNIIHTQLTQTVVQLHNCTNSVITDNIISFEKGGNAVAETGNCKNNFYRKIQLDKSDLFDEYTY